MPVAFAQYGDLDRRPVRPSRRGGLVGVILPEIRAAHRIGFGEPVAQSGLGPLEAVLEPGDVGDRSGRPARGDVGQRGEIVFLAVGMLHQLEAHRRHSDEIGDLLVLDQPKRLARVPFRHQHHSPADDEAVEEHRHLAGDVEQGYVDQSAGRVGRPAALALHDPEQGHQVDRISVDSGGDRPVGGDCALGDSGRSGGEEDGGVVLGRDRGQIGLASAEQGRKRLGDRFLDRKGHRFQVEAGRLQPCRPRGVAQDEAGLGQSEAVAELVRLPPAVDQGCDSARLQHRHIGNDPGRAVAHRDRHPVALADSPSARKRPGQPGRMLVQLCEGQPLAVGDHGGRRPVKHAEGVEHAGKGRRQVGDDLAPFLVLGDLDSAARSGHLRQRRVELAVQLTRHPTLPFRFCFPLLLGPGAGGGSL